MKYNVVKILRSEIYIYESEMAKEEDVNVNVNVIIASTLRRKAKNGRTRRSRT